jgi:hypothetical protein
MVPTGPKGEKRPADVIGAAVKVMRIATGEEPKDYGASSVLARLGSQLGGFPTSTGIPDMSWTLAEKNWSLSLSD